MENTGNEELMNNNKANLSGPGLLVQRSNVMQTVMDEGKLKQIFKEALAEMLEEKKNIFHDIVMETMEDIAMSRAIQEGQGSGTATKKEIFDILEGRV